MKRILLSLCLFITGLAVVGFTSRPYSDLAEYKRLPMKTRILRMQKAGEELFLRRRYEEALVVFRNILSLDKKNMSAMLWITKVSEKKLREKQQEDKKDLYRRYGQLIPKEMTYHNWHWGPSAGHFEVRYSKPKPYVPPVRKVHPKASDEQIKEAEKLAESGKAEDLFELSMRYWSRRMTDKAVAAFFKATKADPIILANDDELLLATVREEIDKKIESGKASPVDYFTSGKIAMIQGDRKLASSHLIKAAMGDKKLKSEINPIMLDFVENVIAKEQPVPADIFSFRQAYVYENQQDLIYLDISLTPRTDGTIIPIDLSLSQKSVSKIEIVSDDAVFAYSLKGVEDSLRIWVVLAEKDSRFAQFDVKMILHIDNKAAPYVELSNYNQSAEQPDNWAFVVGPETSFGESFPKGDQEKLDKGLKISGFQLGLYDGRGPMLDLSNFKNPLPRKVNIWKLIEKQIADSY